MNKPFIIRCAVTVSAQQGARRITQHTRGGSFVVEAESFERALQGAERELLREFARRLKRPHREKGRP